MCRRSMTVLGRVLVILVAAGVAVLPGAPAWAHNMLTSAEPAREATVTAAPTAIRLQFMESLNSAFSVTLTAPGGEQVPTGPPVVDGTTGTVPITAAVPGNGVYRVTYHTVASDGDSAEGFYSFTLADPALRDAVSRPGMSTPVMIGLATFGALCASYAGGLWVVDLYRRRRALRPVSR